MLDEKGELLRALALMSRQYLTNGPYSVDHKFIYAGEYAVDLLAQYGLIEPHDRGGTWTPAGRALLNS